MTEKRSDYRKKNQRKKKNSFFKTIKSAFDNEEEVDVNPEFTRDSTERPFNDEQSSKTRRETQTSSDENNSKYQNKQKAQPKTWVEKGLRLKRRLNIAILIVIVLIVLVLLALFHL